MDPGQEYPTDLLLNPDQAIQTVLQTPERKLSDYSTTKTTRERATRECESPLSIIDFLSLEAKNN